MVCSDQIETNNLRGGDISAVIIKDLCKSYSRGDHGNELVLNKFCMNVKKGSIYGFLGASGCGKTTVLSCIVGLRKWDSGQVFVFGKEPGSKDSGIPGKILGYMPQDLALYNQLSIIETMKFYGRLYNMSETLIRKQWKAISELLNLSKGGSKLIEELSGGQKRRASLALALIHSPQLLVLDEPTVGLDPVLRENIWNYLYQITGRLGTTIIITTHYIEEARYSDMIGLMRRGRLLVEENPTKLMEYYESDLLEQAVLQICRLDQVETRISGENVRHKLKRNEVLKFKSSWKLKNEQKEASAGEMEGNYRALPSSDVQMNSGNGNQSVRKESAEKNGDTLVQCLQKTWGFTWVIFLIFFRYPVFLLLIVLMPSVQGTITLWAIGSKPLGLPLGIVNHEVTDWKSTCESTQNHTFIQSELISGCQLTSGMELKILSCQYLNQLKKDPLVDMIAFSTVEEARAQVEMGNSWGYMIIPQNFSQSFGDLLLAKQYAMNESIEGSRVPIYLDYSQFVSSLFLIRSMYTSYSNFIKELALSCSFSEKMVDLPLNFRDPVYGDNEDNYTAFVMPGLILCSVYGIVSSLSGLLLIGDRTQGTLSRATVAGLSCSNVISSHLIVQGVLTIAQLAIWNLVLYIFFSVPFNGQVWLYIVICLSTGLSGSALGIFLGIILDTEVKALYTGAFLSNVLLLYGGIVWPTESMRKIWQTVASILPNYLPTQSLRSVIVRGVGIEHPLVWPGILVSVAWTLGLVIVSVIFYRRKA